MNRLNALLCLHLVLLLSACNVAEGTPPSEPTRPRVTALAQAGQPAMTDVAPTATPTFGLPPDIAGTATSLAEMIRTTAVPEAPLTSGAAPDLGAEGIAPMVAPAGEAYAHVAEQPFVWVADDPLSTFAIDVDTASYANVRRFLRAGTLPPADAVRVEEMLNYFDYDYAPPRPDHPYPLTLYADVVEAPWEPRHRLVHLSLKAREVSAAERPPANLVFLLDVSGSMADEDKLPLLKHAMHLLVDALRADDRVAIVTYAASATRALPSTPGTARTDLHAAIDGLAAGGSTNGAAGIALAYETAAAAWLPEGINRVVLATDGDFNVGITERSELVRLVQTEARHGVFLTVLGFGTGNYKDATLEQLADLGNGAYAYVDGPAEATKVLVDGLTGTLLTVAKDVKVQVAFNPAAVASYRRIGYDNRALAHADFADDARDAGELGAGHEVTVLYEIVPAEADEGAADDRQLVELAVRYREPKDGTSQEVYFRIADPGGTLAAAPRDVQFAVAVAEFGLLLRRSDYGDSARWDDAIAWAESGRGADPGGYRDELVSLIRAARSLAEPSG